MVLHSVHWYSIGEMRLIMGTYNISNGFRLSRGAFYPSIGTNGTIGTNGMALNPFVKCVSQSVQGSVGKFNLNIFQKITHAANALFIKLLINLFFCLCFSNFLSKLLLASASAALAFASINFILAGNDQKREPFEWRHA